MTHEMVDFFAAARRQFPGLRFLVLTQSDFSLMEEAFASKGVDGDSYRCLRVSPDDLAAYLGLADFAISFIKPTFSKIASSPTKMAEYLAAGLPVVFNAGIGDLDDLESERVGVLIKAFAEDDYERAAQLVRAFLVNRRSAATRCRTAAQRYFSLSAVGIPRYLKLYSSLTALPALGAKPSRTSLATRAGAPVDGEAGPSRTG